MNGKDGQSRKPISLNVNLDSLSECMKLVGCECPTRGFRDACFFQAMDRFLGIAAEYGAPLTVFVIGKDLESGPNAEAVARWRELGHEIGNHSYSHRQDLYLLSDDEIAKEIGKAHEIIQRATGVAPRGFIAPGWASCSGIVKALVQMGYLYDTSLAPSWLLAVAQLMLRLKSPGAREMLPWLRPDWRGNFLGRRGPYVPCPRDYLRTGQDGANSPLVMLPLPTVPWTRLSVWHTLSFQLPPGIFRSVLNQCVTHNPAFYYLMHPADLIDPAADLRGLPDRLRHIERLAVPLNEKERRLRLALDLLRQRGRFVVMSELAQQFLRETAQSVGA